MDQHLALDVHQHLWPAELVDRLRARSRSPYLRGWTLHLAGEPPFEVAPHAHDPELRVGEDHRAGVGAACLSLSAPLGIERLGVHATALLDCWHDGVRGLPAHFRAWASVSSFEPDLAHLTALLADERFVGVQLPATDLLTPSAWERAGDLLTVVERAGRAVFVHPGPVDASPAHDAPGWWAPVVDYPAQLQAAWWAWHGLRGRELFATLRVLFAAGAGLAPLQHERFLARGGAPLVVDPGVFVDTSSYDVQGLDALTRVLGIDGLTLGSDRPYGTPVSPVFGDAATHAVRVANPRRLLGADVNAPAPIPTARLRAVRTHQEVLT